jgi:hypothetical protein
MVRAYSKLLDACWEETLDKGPYRWDGDQNKVPWDNVLSGDRFYLLLRVHDVLYGSKYEFGLTCRSCGQPYRWAIDTVADVDVLPLKDEARAVLLGSGQFTGALPDGTEVVYLPSTGKLEGKVSDKEESTLRFILPRLVSLGGERNVPAMREALMDMDADVFDALQAMLQDMDCGPDTSIWTKCTKCDAVGRADLPFDRSFWFPASTR